MQPKIQSGFTGERAIVLPGSMLENFSEDELGKLLYITDIGFYPNAGFHFRKRDQQEAGQFILIYCVEGDGWFIVNDIKYKVGANNFFILPKGQAHSYGCNRNKTWTIYWIHFDGTMADYFSSGMDKPNLIMTEKNSRIKERLELFEEIFSTLKNGYSKSNLAYSSTCLFHFLSSLKFMSAYRETVSEGRETVDLIDQSIHYMRENVHKKLSLEEIARYTGYSTSHFSALFFRKTGLSPIHYLIQLKIQEACHLLDFTDMKITQISMTIGFDDPLYFSRIFRKTMGIPPLQYRRKKKG